jgi:hypothetical protein
MADKTTIAAAPAAAPQPAAAPPATWFLDANTIKCIVQQETNLSHGDEIYVASLKFRTRLGVAGTTSVVFTGGLVDIEDIKTGETHTIPNSMGRIAFANVTRLGFAEIGAGQSPEAIGTATVVVESDGTPDRRVDRLFTEAAEEVEPLIAAASEQITFEDLADEEELAALLNQLIEDINAALKQKLLQKLAGFVVSGLDADDEIDRKLNVFVAVDDVLAPFVDAKITEALDPDDGVGGGLRTRTYTQTFAGRGGKYEVSFTLSK